MSTADIRVAGKAEPCMLHEAPFGESG